MWFESLDLAAVFTNKLDFIWRLILPLYQNHSTPALVINSHFLNALDFPYWLVKFPKVVMSKEKGHWRCGVVYIISLSTL